MFVGTISEIWRYPVSSIGGERLDAAVIGAHGVPYDRCWALVDRETGKPASPENDHRWRPALFLRSRMVGRAVEIRFPDGQWLQDGDARLNGMLTDYFGFQVALCRYGDDAADTPSVVNRYQPSPVHLLTTAALDELTNIAATNQLDSRRFRPTLVIQTHGLEGFVEHGWLGKAITAGSAILLALEETKRCGMTLIAQPGIEENAEILRSIVRRNRRNLGIYCTVPEPGEIALHEKVALAP